MGEKYLRSKITGRISDAYRLFLSTLRVPDSAEYKLVFLNYNPNLQEKDFDSYIDENINVAKSYSLPDTVVTGYISPEDALRSRAWKNSRSANAAPYTYVGNAMDASQRVKLLSKVIPDDLEGSIFNPSTCLMTATSMYGPEYISASNNDFINNPELHGFRPINKDEVRPGDLIILSPKDKTKHHHAVIFDGYAIGEGVGTHPVGDNGYPEYHKGDMMVNYSNGGRNKDNYRWNMPLSVFTDPKYGLGFSDLIRYYRVLPNFKRKK